MPGPPHPSEPGRRPWGERSQGDSPQAASSSRAPRAGVRVIGGHQTREHPKRALPKGAGLSRRTSPRRRLGAHGVTRAAAGTALEPVLPSRPRSRRPLAVSTQANVDPQPRGQTTVAPGPTPGRRTPPGRGQQRTAGDERPEDATCRRGRGAVESQESRELPIGRRGRLGALRGGAGWLQAETHAAPSGAEAPSPP